MDRPGLTAVKHRLGRSVRTQAVEEAVRPLEDRQRPGVAVARQEGRGQAVGGRPAVVQGLGEDRLVPHLPQAEGLLPCIADSPGRP